MNCFTRKFFWVKFYVVLIYHFNCWNNMQYLKRSNVLVSIFTLSLIFSDKNESCSTQLIDGDGTFNVSGLENFMKEVKLGSCGLSYAVVSIMGPQSSGM